MTDISHINDIADAAYNAGVLEGATAPRTVYVLKIDENQTGYEVEVFARLEDAEEQLARRRYDTLASRRHWDDPEYAECLAAGDAGDWAEVNDLWDFDDAFDFYTHIEMVEVN